MTDLGIGSSVFVGICVLFNRGLKCKVPGLFGWFWVFFGNGVRGKREGEWGRGEGVCQVGLDWVGLDRMFSVFFLLLLYIGEGRFMEMGIWRGKGGGGEREGREQM